MKNLLTVVAPNRDRLMDNNSTHFFFKSLCWQKNQNFNITIVDGGSSNFDWVKKTAFKYNKNINVIQHMLGQDFIKPLLNNVGIRNSTTDYVMTTDVDLLYGPNFIDSVISNLEENAMIESRTMYWKDYHANKIYKGEFNPEKDLEPCKSGRIKKRTTCGGCQCLHISNWNKLRGFDETYIGWGSEDFDLLRRAQLANIKIKWLGESMSSIMLFHQPHHKDLETIKKELQQQGRNQQILYNIKSYEVNPKGWGGINE